MPASKLCLVEIVNYLPVRIFRSKKEAAKCQGEVQEWDKYLAKCSIRLQIYERSNRICEVCQIRPITWVTMDMHETKPRGMTHFKLGEVSIYNSVAACRECHRGKDGVHKNRRLYFAKLPKNPQF